MLQKLYALWADSTTGMGSCRNLVISSTLGHFAVKTLNAEISRVSLMGEFHKPLQHFLFLASIPPIARTMTQLPGWAPVVQNGREAQTSTVLGPAFGITSLPEDSRGPQHTSPVAQPQPNVATTLFSNAETRGAEVSHLPVHAFGIHL